MSSDFEWFEIQAIIVAYSAYSHSKLIYDDFVLRKVYVIKTVRNYFLEKQNLFSRISVPDNDQRSFAAKISKRCSLKSNKEFVERLFKEIPSEI